MTALVLMSAACGRGEDVHTAKILDVRLAVTVDSVRVAPAETQFSPPRRHRTVILLHVAISSPAAQPVWANGCSAEAFDSDDERPIAFTFVPGGPAGAYLEAHGSYDEVIEAVVPASPRLIRQTSRVTARCQAWDWGSTPPE